MYIETAEARYKEQCKNDAEYLRICLTKTSKQVGLLSPNIWYASGDTMLSIANILENHGYLRSASDAIRFFEKPYHFENDMRELAEELEPEVSREGEGI